MSESIGVFLNFFQCEKPEPLDFSPTVSEAAPPKARLGAGAGARESPDPRVSLLMSSDCGDLAPVTSQPWGEGWLSPYPELCRRGQLGIQDLPANSLVMLGFSTGPCNVVSQSREGENGSSSTLTFLPNPVVLGAQPSAAGRMGGIVTLQTSKTSPPGTGKGFWHLCACRFPD